MFTKPTLSLRPIFPDPGESEAEEEQTADIDSTDVAQLVKTSVIVAGKNINVLADDETWQRHRHQASMRAAVEKSERPVFRINERRSPRVKKTEQDARDYQPQFHENDLTRPIPLFALLSHCRKH